MNKKWTMKGLNQKVATKRVIKSMGICPRLASFGTCLSMFVHNNYFICLGFISMRSKLT